jgi:O-antigen ligase
VSVRVSRSATGPPGRWYLAGGVVALTAALIPAFALGRGPLLLAGIAGAIAAAWVVVNPYWGLMAVQAGWFVRAGIAPYAIAAILVLPLALAVLRDRRVAVLRATPIRLLWGVGAMLLLSLWWNEIVSPVPKIAAIDETWQEMAIFALRLLFLVFVFYFVRTPGELAGFVGLAIALIVAAALSAWPAFIASGGSERAAATFSLGQNENRLAHICLFAISLLWWYRTLGPRPVLRRLCLPLIAFLALTTLATGSRGGLLQFVLLIALVLGFQRGWSPAKRLRSIVLLLCLVVVAIAAAPAAQLMRATSFSPERVNPAQDSLKNRINTVLVALDLGAENPVFGVGIGNFKAVKRTLHGLPRREETHNSYLWAVMAGGVPALALYLALFWTTHRTLAMLEAGGPRDLLWIVRGFRFNLLLFLLFSAVADFWASEVFALVIGVPMAAAQIAWGNGRVPATAWHVAPATTGAPRPAVPA